MWGHPYLLSHDGEQNIWAVGTGNPVTHTVRWQWVCIQQEKGQVEPSVKVSKQFGCKWNKYFSVFRSLVQWKVNIRRKDPRTLVCYELTWSDRKCLAAMEMEGKGHEEILVASGFLVPSSCEIC